MSAKFLSAIAGVAIALGVSILFVTSGCGENSSSVVKNEREPEVATTTTGGGGTAVAKPKPGGGGAGAPYDKSMATAVIKGVVSFEGKAPKMPPIDVTEKVCKEHHADNPMKEERIVVSDDNKLANVVVYVSKMPKEYNFDSLTLPNAHINQEGCQYLPHVLAMKTSQVLDIESSDPVTHNIHYTSQYNSEDNLSQPSKGILGTHPHFETPELGIKVKCDVHGWMKAFICVFDHPFFAVTKADGTFEINVPPGEYTVTTWHEQQMPPVKVVASAPVVVKAEADKPGVANFTYKMK